MGFSKSQDNLDETLPHLIRLARRARKIRILGSAALELAYVASGRLDAYIERTINLWDVAAGALLVENAGGEFYTLPAPDGKLRMCADNGRLRKKLQTRQPAEIVAFSRRTILPAWTSRLVGQCGWDCFWLPRFPALWRAGD